MTNYTNYNEEFKVRILTDYADTEKTCWASDSGKTVAECWCAQCIEGRTLYPVFHEINLMKAEAVMLRDAASAHRAKLTSIREFIQGSIDRDEWTESELEEPFWTELADMVGVDLKQVEDIDITVTLTYSGTVTIPKGIDLGDITFDTSWHLTSDYLGQELDELTYSDIEITQD
jgi:hypothetical protein